MPGLPEMLVIAVIVLLFFGHRLPIVGRALGRSVNEFKDGLAGDEDESLESEPPQEKQKALGYNPDE